MSKRKPKELYQAGFLCLYDKQGEMLFRPKTDFSCYHGVVYNHVDDDEKEGPLVWRSYRMDTDFLHESNEEINEFVFIGHFDIHKEKNNNLRFSFGEGHMEGADGVSVSCYASEDWEYLYYDNNELSNVLNLEKLRVIID